MLPEPMLTPDELVAHRPTLRAHCYRMLGHPQDADEAVQDTLERAIGALGGFRGEASPKTWLVRIATRVCIDRQRRRRMPTASPPSGPDGPFAATDPGAWIAPVPDGWLLAPETPPDERAHIRQSVRLALITALQQLSPTQRAAWLLAEVFEWPARDIAETLDWTVAGVNSALQRARARLERPRRPRPVGSDVVERYQAAFERFDLDALVALLTDDVTFDMPPIPQWLCGRRDVHAFLRGAGAECEGSVLVPVDANGHPGFAQYRHGGRTPWGLVVLEPDGDRIAAIHTFLDVEAVFPWFSMPLHGIGRESAMSREAAPPQ